ncbi:MAG: DUF503 domain-containing protein [bacterium]|nr:DUF503 domain-containing protein [bacterium]
MDMHTESTHSLKEKRHIVSSLKEKLKHKFNISVIESDYQDLWQKIQVAVAMVSNSKTIIGKSFDQIEDFIYQNYPVRIISIDKDFM